MSPLHSSIVAIVTLASSIAAKHPDKGQCQHKRCPTGIEIIKAKIVLPYLKTAILMLVKAARFASQGQILFEIPSVVSEMLLPGVAFFAIAFLVTIAAGHFLRPTYQECALLVFTTTVRNSEASLAIAVTAFNTPLVDKMF